MDTIEIITFEGCDTAQKLVADLESLRPQESFELRTRIVPSSDRAAELGLYGSPTIMLNGREYQKDPSSRPGFY